MLDLAKIAKNISDYLPLEKIYYTVLVVYISIATNDIQLPPDSFIRRSYFMHIVVIFILSFFSIDLQGTKHIIKSRLISAAIVTFIFYLITKPVEYNIFSTEFYNKYGIYPAT